MKLKPLGDRLIVQALEEEETTASGILLPDTAKEKPQKGKVLAVGDGQVNEDTGTRTPVDVSEGDEVLYSKYGGTEIKVDGEELLVLPDTAKEKPQKGKVIAVGDGKVNEDTGKRTPLDVSEGDEVLYSKYGGTEIVVDGEDLLVLRESDVLAKVQS